MSSRMAHAPDKKAQRSYYNDRWRNTPFVNRPKLVRAIAILEAVMASRHVRPRTIELGCGSGWLTSMLASLGPATGVDLSDVAISAASERYPQTSFMATDIFSWSYPLAAFDLVVSHEVLEHVQDQERYLDIAADLLSAGGHLVLTTPNRGFHEAKSPEARASYESQPIENWLFLDQLKELVSKRFEVVELKTILLRGGARGLYGLAGSRLLGAAKRVRLLWLFEEVLLRLGRGSTSLILARKR